MGAFNLNSIWLAILLLNIVVAVHELGHFLAARACGVKVHEFSIGFGPLVTKFNWKGVQYSLRWILIGGFCKIAGMDIALEGEPEQESVPQEKLFYFKPLWQKLIILVAGPFFNLLMAILVLFGTAAFIGLPGPTSNALVYQVTAGSPANQAGIRKGDQIVALNRKSIQGTEIAKIIGKSGGKPLQVTVRRNGVLLTKELTPKYDTAAKRYTMGIVYGVLPKLERVSLGQAAGKALSLPVTMVKLVGMIFNGRAKADLSGPIMVVDMVDQSLQLPLIYILVYLLSFSVTLNMSLFLFNLIPIPLPILDGGWVAILLLERLFHHEFSTEQKAAAQMLGLLLVIILAVMATYGDILRIVRRLLGG
ncbi:MAG TPA: M50 family metallopeptidase [Bacillota bacterium]